MSNANKGISKLASVMVSRMSKQSEHPPDLDFGTIKKNGTLQTDSFPVNIQKNDYAILEHCKSNIKEGTVRVLVAWVEDDPVVIGVLSDEEEVQDE